MMLSTSPDRGAHPARSRSNTLHLDGRRGVCFVGGQVIFCSFALAARDSLKVGNHSHAPQRLRGRSSHFLAHARLRRTIRKKHESHCPAPQQLRGRMCKGILHIKQPAPNIACSGWWGVCAFLDSFLALGFLRFDGESALRPTTTNADRWVANNQGMCYERQEI